MIEESVGASLISIVFAIGEPVGGGSFISVVFAIGESVGEELLITVAFAVGKPVGEKVVFALGETVGGRVTRIILVGANVPQPHGLMPNTDENAEKRQVIGSIDNIVASNSAHV